jgi:hypothetical protein
MQGAWGLTLWCAINLKNSIPNTECLLPFIFSHPWVPVTASTDMTVARQWPAHSLYTVFYWCDGRVREGDGYLLSLTKPPWCLITHSGRDFVVPFLIHSETHCRGMWMAKWLSPLYPKRFPECTSLSILVLLCQRLAFARRQWSKGREVAYVETELMTGFILYAWKNRVK